VFFGWATIWRSPKVRKSQFPLHQCGVKNFNDEVGGTGGIHDRLWMVGSIHPVKRAPAVAAQETSQPEETK
jgi:hypothetical protein